MLPFVLLLPVLLLLQGVLVGEPLPLLMAVLVREWLLVVVEAVVVVPVVQLPVVVEVVVELPVVVEVMVVMPVVVEAVVVVPFVPELA